MMIEQNTNYAYKLKYMDNLTFDKVRDLSTKFYRELPQALQDELFEALNRGIDILDSEPQMTAYLFAFGKMHQAKLNYAFGKLPKEFFEQPEINIIDYGCGQALGTLCYIDFLNKNNYWQKVNSITLIDPSEICLKRAALHASVFFPEARIITINKRFDDLNERDIACNEWLDGLYMRREIEENEFVPKLHLFSNVLDMDSFDMKRLAKLILGRAKHYNQFVCTGPLFHNGEKANKILCFSSLFCKDYSYESLEKRKLNADKDWTCSTSVFSLGTLMNRSTKVTNEELNEAEEVDGPSGYMYNNGGRLLKLSDFNHTILPGTSVICCRAIKQYDCETYTGIPDSVQIIGKYAFQSQSCNFSIPNNILSIEDGAFEDCYNLTTVHIPQSVRYIGGNPFAKCPENIIKSDSNRFIVNDEMLIDKQENRLVCYFGNAESVTLPSTITNIGYKAFAGRPVKQITIPNTINIIGDNPFDGCKDISVSSQSSRFIVKDEMLIDIKENRLIAYLGDSERINVPKYIKSIGGYAFCGKSVKQLYISDSVCYMGEGALSSCVFLKQVILPNAITRIEDETFFKCTSLKYVKLPESLSFIGDDAFYGCSNLQQIDLPQTLTYIGHKAFSWCSALQQVVLPNTLESIGGEAFSHCGLKQIVVPNSVNSFGDHVFESSSLVQVIIPDIALSKNKGLFQNCSSLQQVIITEQNENIAEIVSTIPNNTFDWCLSLRQISLPETVSAIGEYAFRSCQSLQNIEMSSIKTIKKGAFIDCKSLKKVIVPNGVKSIGEDAFNGCGLREVVLPETVCSIGENAFRCRETKRVVAETHVEDGKSKFHFRYADEPPTVFGHRARYNQSFLSWRETLQRIIIPRGTMERFKDMLDMKLWDKLVEE